MPFIVSLHIPKTAGTSLLSIYQATFGDRLLEYNKDPKAAMSGSPEEIKQRFDIIHGHLNAAALNHVMDDDAIAVTFLRDPVQRILSSYFFHRNPKTKNLLGEEVRSTSMSLEAFADMPSQRNLQSKMIGLVGRERLDFIGITERFSKSVELLSESSSLELKFRTSANVNGEKAVGTAYDVSSETHDFIADRNERDIELYQSVYGNFDA